MSFLAKVDKFGLASASLEILTSDEGRAASVAEASNADGDIIAAEVYGEIESPSCTYAVKADSTADIELGGVTTVGTGTAAKYYALTSVTIGTSAGSPPTVSASGEEVPSATPSSTYTVEDGLTVSKLAIAQIYGGSFTLGGTGCHVTDCNATISCDFSAATKDGARLAWDISNGRIVVSVTINQTGSTAPTLTAGSGWEITSPLTQSNPDSNFPTWTATLTKYLTKDA